MPINGTKYPICDTDLWIKLCGIDRTDIIFGQYPNIFMADIVNEEIQNKAKSDRKFSCARQRFQEYYKTANIVCIVFKNNIHFNEIEKNLVLRAFKQHRITYDETKGTFTQCKNIGEKVTVIYAAVLELHIVLSDDGGCVKFINEFFPTVKIKRLLTLINDMYPKDNSTIKTIMDEVKKYDTQVIEEGFSLLAKYKETLKNVSNA